MDASFFRRRLVALRLEEAGEPAVLDELEAALAWLAPEAGQTAPVGEARQLSSEAHALFIQLLDEAIAARPHLPSASRLRVSAEQDEDPVYTHALTGHTADEAETTASPTNAPPPDTAFLAFEADRFLRRYELVDVIGHGTFGQVLRARDRYLQRDVALKRINITSLASHDEAARRLFRYSLLLEARVGAQLVHPHLVPIHDFGFDAQGNPYLVMRYLDGGRTLRDMLLERKTGEPVSRDELLKVLIKVCDGLSFAHAHGVVHRDVKPENIYVADFDDVTVLDWGIARLLDKSGLDLAEFSALLGESPQARRAGHAPAALAEQRSLFGGRVGTPAYMAPEQARAENSAVDARTDVWALGVILYEVLTGERPFGDSKQQGVLDRVLDGHFELPSQRVEAKLQRTRRGERPRSDSLRRPQHGKAQESGVAKETAGSAANSASASRVGVGSTKGAWLPERVPPELDRIVARALAYRREARYPSLRQMRDDLEAFRTRRPLEGASPWEVLRKWAGRNRVAVVGSVLAMLLLAAGLVFGITRYVQDVSEERREAAHQRAEAKRHEQAAFEEREAARASREAAERTLAEAALYRGRTLGSRNRWSQAREHFAEAKRIQARHGRDTTVAELGLWDARRHAPAPVQELSLPSAGQLRGLFLCDAGWRLLAVDTAGAAQTWDAALGQRLAVPRPLEAPPDAQRVRWRVEPRPAAAEIQPGVFALAAADGHLRAVALPGSEPSRRVRLPPADDGTNREEGAHNDPAAEATAPGEVQILAARPAHPHLWLGTARGELILWDWRRGRPRMRFRQGTPGAALVSLAWHEASHTLFAVSAEGTVTAWSLPERLRSESAAPAEPAWRLELPDAPLPESLAVIEGPAGEGARLLVGSTAGVEVIRATTGESAGTLYSSRTRVYALAPLQEAPGLAYVVSEGYVELWSVARRTPRLLSRFALPGGLVSARLEPRAGLLLAGFAEEPRVRLFSLGVRGGKRLLPGHHAPVEALAVPPSARHTAEKPRFASKASSLPALLISGDAEGVAHVWDLASARMLRRLTDSGGRLVAVGFVADGRGVLTAAVDEERGETTLRHYDLLASADLERLSFSTARFQPLPGGISPDGRWVVLSRAPPSNKEPQGEPHRERDDGDERGESASPGLFLWRVGGSRVPRPVPHSVLLEGQPALEQRTVAFADGGTQLVQLDASAGVLRRWHLDNESAEPLQPQRIEPLEDEPAWLRLSAPDELGREVLYLGYRHAARLDVFVLAQPESPATSPKWRLSASLSGEQAERIRDAVGLLAVDERRSRGGLGADPEGRSGYALTFAHEEPSASLWALAATGEPNEPSAVTSTYVLSTNPTVPHVLTPLPARSGEAKQARQLNTRRPTHLALGGDTGLISLLSLDFDGLAERRRFGEPAVEPLRAGNAYALQGAWTLAHRCFTHAREQGEVAPPATAARAAWLAGMHSAARALLEEEERHQEQAPLAERLLRSHLAD